jgi:acetyl esterase/lipase
MMNKFLWAFVIVAQQVLAGAPAPDNLQKDVVYGKAGDVELKLDLAVPKDGDGPFPLLVFIHGGGWQMGNKASHTGAVVNWSKKGYVAATIGYRFAPKYPFPAQVEDVKCAIRYLRSKAKELKIDVNKVAAIGYSAGGHLSLMLGLMDPSDGLEGSGGNDGISSKVQAVVNYFGPTDFTKESPIDNPVGKKLVTDFMGTTDLASPLFKQASPITYINKGDPPVITFQGAADPLVPAQQAKTLHAILKEKGVTEHLELIENGGHGFAGADNARTVKMMEEFLKKHLGGAAAAAK